MRADCHMHTYFSGDSEAKPEEMVLAAIDKGLEAICFTDHEDIDYFCDDIEFVFDPETFQVSDLKMIGTRKSYPTGEGKKPNLADCVFTSGIVKRDDGRYDLYSGVGDTAEGRVIIENPFPAKIKE